MFRFIQNPSAVRIGSSLLSLLLLSVAISNFYRAATLPTDENLFRDPPSYLLVTRHLPDAEPTGQRGTAGLKEGDLLVAINDRRLKTAADVKRVLAQAGPESYLTLQTVKPASGTKFTYRIPMKSLREDFVRELPPVAWVIEIFEGGASERAGLRVGDFIHKINGQSFRNSHEADRILRQAQLDRSIVYEIFRGNQPGPVTCPSIIIRPGANKSNRFTVRGWDSAWMKQTYFHGKYRRSPFPISRVMCFCLLPTASPKHLTGEQKNSEKPG